jgi:serine/threonine protein kinase
METLIGKQLGSYVIQAEIGRGGMAVVYKAYQSTLERHVAIKVLPQQFAFDREFVERFLREARAAARLNHPHIVTIHDVGEADGTYYIVMEYLEGPSLADLLRQQRALPPQQAAQVVAQVASALDYAHGQGFVHRDVKPSNILLGAEGVAKLTDFGIVRAAEGTRLTQTGTLLGTPEYMSPEQAKGLGVDRRSDIYSLGVVAYEALTGRGPFSGDTLAVLHAHVYESPDLSTLPRGVGAVVGKALAKEPGQRYESAKAFAQALGAAMRMPVVERMVEPPTRKVVGPRVMRPWPRPVPGWLWAVGGLGAGAVLVIVLALTFGGHGAIPTPTESHSTASTSTSPPIRATLPSATVGSTTVADTSTPTEVVITPSPTISMSTREPAAAYHPIPLGGTANARLSVDFLSPPAGDVTLGGVPFRVSEWVFKSQASPSPNNSYPTTILLPMDVPQAYQVHLLLTAGNGFNRFDGKVLGRVVAYCDAAAIAITDLQLGRDVREWHVADNVISTASRARQVWSGAITNFPNLSGHIDMLSLDLPAACLSGGLTAIEVIDDSANTVNSLDPAINLMGITVEHYQ